MSHRIERPWQRRLARAIPFGLGRVKPHHFRDMARVAWENRDNPGYAWKVLSQGVCDGCALGAAGLHDWTIDGIHLCMTRLNLLRLNTMPALDVRRLADVAGAARAAQRRAARARAPALPAAARSRRPRLSAHQLGRGIRAHRRAHPLQRAAPHRVLFHLPRHHQRDLLRRAEGGALPRHQQHRQRRAPLPLAVDRRDEARARRRRHHVQLSRLVGHATWSSSSARIPANDQPVTMKYLHEAKRLGTKVVLVNPYASRAWSATGCRRRRPARSSAPTSPTTGSASRIGGDIAFLYGVLKILIEQGWVDQAFIDAHTDGIAELAPPRRARTGRSSSARRPAARQHGGVRRARPRRGHRRAGVEHGHHAARLRRPDGADDRQPRRC